MEKLPEKCIDAIKRTRNILSRQHWATIEATLVNAAKVLI